MAVQADADGERDVGGELDEPRSPVPIQDVEVHVVHRHLGPVEVEARGSALVAAPGLGAEGLVVLLGHADQNPPLLAAEPAEVPLGDLVLPLSRLELHDGDALALGVFAYRADEPLGHLAQQRGRRDRVAAVLGEKPGELPGTLESRYVPPEVDAVDALDLERDVLLEHRFHVRHGGVSFDGIGAGQRGGPGDHPDRLSRSGRSCNASPS